MQFIVLEICRYFKENSIIPKYTTYFFISNYEETGSEYLIPRDTVEIIAIDVGIVERARSMNLVVSIAAKDRSSPMILNLEIDYGHCRGK